MEQCLICKPKEREEFWMKQVGRKGKHWDESYCAQGVIRKLTRHMNLPFERPRREHL